MEEVRMGEQYFCPHCDHVDNVLGECPECGGNLTKLEVESEKRDEADLYDDFAFEPLEAEDAMDDFADDAEPGFGSLGII